MAESPKEATPLIPLPILEVAAATTVVEFLIELRIADTRIVLCDLPGVLAALLRTAWPSIQKGLSYSRHHFGNEDGLSLTSPEETFYLWYSGGDGTELRQISSSAALSAAADAVSQPLEDAAMGAGFEGATVELLPIVKAVNEEMTRVLRDTLPPSVASSAASLHDIKVVYTSTDSGGEINAQYMACSTSMLSLTGRLRVRLMLYPPLPMYCFV